VIVFPTFAKISISLQHKLNGQNREEKDNQGRFSQSCASSYTCYVEGNTRQGADQDSGSCQYLFETHIPFHNPSAQNGKAKKSGKQIKKTTPKEPSSSSSSNSKSEKEPTVQNAPSSKVDVACFATFLITYVFTGEGRFF